MNGFESREESSNKRISLLDASSGFQEGMLIEFNAIDFGLQIAEKWEIVAEKVEGGKRGFTRALNTGEIHDSRAGYCQGESESFYDIVGGRPSTLGIVMPSNSWQAAIIGFILSLPA